MGYLDWASQPSPFRTFEGSPRFPLFPRPDAPALGYVPPSIAYDDLAYGRPAAEPMVAAAIGDVLRHALGLSAWKQFRDSSWSLRVNPSSGNLHPTAAYIVSGATSGLANRPGVYHYAPDRHELDLRCVFEERAWESVCLEHPHTVLVALTSIHWREAWKYGERAFRYCQHDLGHAQAALAISSAMVGWRTFVLPAWSHRAIRTLTGLDRDGDFLEAEREDPGCLIALTRACVPNAIWNADERLVAAVANGQWSGSASQLSEHHVQWTFIDEIAAETQDSGLTRPSARHAEALRREGGRPADTRSALMGRRLDARQIILQRRSALAFDVRSAIDRQTFVTMLSRVIPGPHAPWDALWWTPRVHLAIFVHRVEDLAPGLYLLPRHDDALEPMRTAFRNEFLWESADETLPLVCLARGDCTGLAERLSCDQAIAADGFFSLGMIARFDASLEEHGLSFYRHLFWETGVVGQVLYLEAEAAGVRATGIGCFFDDPVHAVLGLQGHAFQSLYHFSVGRPVEDTRLMTEGGYPWSR